MFLKWFLGSLWLVPWVAVVKELWRWHINWVFQSMLLPFEEFFRVKILVDPFWAERFLWEYIFRVGLKLWVLWRGAIFFGRYMERLLCLLKIVNERVRFGSWDMAVSPCIKYVVEYLPWGWNSSSFSFLICWLEFFVKNYAINLVWFLVIVLRVLITLYNSCYR